MKISELNTERATDILIELTPYISNICSDNDFMNELKRKVDIGESASTSELMVAGADKINKLIPLILKKHRRNIFGIIAVLNDMKEEQVGKQNFLKTCSQVRDIFKDEELIDFFKSFVASDKKG